MKLFYRRFGKGQPFIILHGLFGQSDNWNTLAKQFAKTYEVFTIDIRNHGLSPHSEIFTYEAMSDDLIELVQQEKMQKIILLGHSMGGKVAMQFALNHSQHLFKLIISDIAPKKYSLQHDNIIEALLSVNFDIIRSRKVAEEQLAKYISDYSTKQFLLKNLYWKNDNQLAWRFNLDVINRNIEHIGNIFLPENQKNVMPTLFLRGDNSKYILDSDIKTIQKYFPNSKLESIANSGHWIHADQPQFFFDSVMRFCNE